MNPRRRGHRARFALALTLTVALPAALAAVATGCGSVTRTDGGTGLLSERSMAPDFHANDQQNQTHTLAEFRGRAVVLYFYPRDGTPGCTREACAFRDAWERLAATGAQVLGVSTDDVASHARFAREHNLPFPLLSDPDGHILRAYGVGRMLGMASRVTFIIGPDGRVVKVFPHVDPGVHADDVIRVLQGLPGAAAPAASPTPGGSAAGGA